MKLISMTDFVLEQSQKIEDLHDSLCCAIAYNKIENYANFLKQPLELWMFVPCDEDGKVLEKDKINDGIKIWKYQKAKQRCLFDGFEVDVFGYAYNGEIRISFPNNSTIESYADFDFQLTQTVIKQLGL